MSSALPSGFQGQRNVPRLGLEQLFLGWVPVMGRVASPPSDRAVALLGALLADLKGPANLGPRQPRIAGVLYNPTAGSL